MLHISSTALLLNTNVPHFKPYSLSFQRWCKSGLLVLSPNILDYVHTSMLIYSTLDIRISLTDTSAITFLHSMILTHTGYRITNWSYTCLAAIGPIELCYKLALKILDRKPMSYYHCQIRDKYKFLNFTNSKLFKSVSNLQGYTWSGTSTNEWSYYTKV